MSGKIIPRCPKCNKRAINWLEGNASFTCQNNHCKTEFEIVDGRVLVVEPMTFKNYFHQPLTITAGSDISCIKIP